MEPTQAAFIGNVFWWTFVSVVVGLLVRMLDPEGADELGSTHAPDRPGR